MGLEELWASLLLLSGSTSEDGRSDVLTPGGRAGSHYAHMQTAGTPTDSPVALLARIAEGDREAFSRFYDAFASLALGLISRILRDPVRAPPRLARRVETKATD